MNIGARLLVVGVGLGVMALGVRDLRRFWLALRHGFRTVGTVIRIEDRPGRSTRVYAPVVRFVDEHGERHEFTGDTASSRRFHTRGDELPVVHPPGRPDQAMIASRGYATVSLVLPLAVGIVFVLVGLLV